MADLVLHASTKKQFDSIVSDTPNAILIVGPDGSGKLTLARALAEQTLEISNLDAYAYGLILDSVDNKAIGIEEVRQIDQFLSLKVPINKPKNRAVIINSAHKLTLESQNALLKTLEAVPLDTVIVLNSTSAHALLPTVRSRLQHLVVNKPPKLALRQHFKDIDETTFEQNYALSRGLAGKLSDLLSDQDSSLSTARQTARDILTKSSYERLMMVDSLSKDRPLCIDSINLIKQMADVSLAQASANSNKWQRALKASYEASEALNKNGQTKLVLTKLMLSL